MKIDMLRQVVKPRGELRASELDVRRLEEALSAPIPEPLRTLLKDLDAFYFSTGTSIPSISINGKTYCPQRFLGIRDSQKSILNVIEVTGLSDRGWVPFAQDLFGNLFFFAASGEIAFVDYDEHYGANGYEFIARDMGEFFERIEVT